MASRGPSLLGRVREHFDWTLFLVAALLGVIGVVNLYSATSVARAALSDVYVQQVYWLVFGGILATIVAAIDYRHYERLGYLLYAVGIVLLLLVFILGKDIRGSSRWIYIGSFSFQPSEFMKLFLCIALAKYLHDDAKSEERSLKDLVVPAILTGVPTLLVLKQPDLGTALIIFLMFVSICALVRFKARQLLLVARGRRASRRRSRGTTGSRAYQKERITSFLNPDANVLGAGWHAHHARIAIGDGGVFGQGFMRGTQNQFLFLPDQYSDFPFAVFAEDWGFVGSIAARRALRVPGPLGDPHRRDGARPLRRRPRDRRREPHLLARALQPRDGHGAPPGRRRHAAAVLVRRLERPHDAHRHRALDERLDAALLRVAGAQRWAAFGLNPGVRQWFTCWSLPRVSPPKSSRGCR